MGGLTFKRILECWCPSDNPGPFTLFSSPHLLHPLPLSLQVSKQQWHITMGWKSQKLWAKRTLSSSYTGRGEPCASEVLSMHGQSVKDWKAKPVPIQVRDSKAFLGSLSVMNDWSMCAMASNCTLLPLLPDVYSRRLLTCRGIWLRLPYPSPWALPEKWVWGSWLRLWRTPPDPSFIVCVSAYLFSLHFLQAASQSCES